MNAIPPGQTVSQPVRVALPASADARAWQVGQMLTALVRSSGPESAVLRIAGQTIEAGTSQRLPEGQVLRLEVASLHPRVTLRLMPEGGRQAALLNEAQRSLLPRQAPPNNLIASLVSASDNRQLPAPVREAATALLRAAPAVSELGQEGRLREVIRNSGLLFEHKLLQVVRQQTAPATLAEDQKSMLANLLRHLFRAMPDRPRSTEGAQQVPPGPRGMTQPIPPQPATPPSLETTSLLALLARQTDGALARVQLSQVNLLAADSQMPWVFEVPVRDGDRTDLLRLMLDREPESEDEQAERGWTVRLTLDNAELGPLHCTVILRGRTVSTNWWAERQATAHEVDAQLQTLAERLQALDLHIGGMRCVHGKPPPPPDRPRRSGELFDVRA